MATYTTILSNVPETLDLEATGLVRASKIVLNRHASKVQNQTRGRIIAAGLGQRLANTVRRSKAVETATGLEVTIRSVAKVTHTYPDGTRATFDLLAIFQADHDIHAHGKLFMAIPLPEAGRRAGRAARVSDFPAGSLVAKVHGDHGVLVYKDEPDRPLFILAAEVHLRKRLDFEAVRRLADEDLSGPIFAEWAKTRASVALKLVA